MFLRNKICLIAIGTVGDVLPLVHVANQLSDDTTVVSFSSHVDHQSWLLPLIKGAGVAFLPIELPPARGPYEGQRPAACASGIEEHLEACIRVCEDALDIKLGGTESDRAQLNHQDGSAVCHRLIVHNLFALEGFHIAEALGVRSLVVSACLPYPPPTAFQTRLKTAYPWLWNALQHQGEGVRWAEIEHWMWPLFTERWGAWRQERLRLPAVPYQTALTLPAAPPLLLCLSPCLVDQLPTWPSSIKVCGSIKPAAECGRVKRKGQHWPGKETSWQKGRCFGKMATAETAAACVGSNVMTGQDRDAPGSGIAEDDHKRESMSESATTYETELMKALKAADRSSAPMNRPKRFTFSQNNGSILDLIGIEVDIVCIDFGSMGSMGLLGDAKQVVEILALALEQSGVCGVLLTGQWDALLDAHMELSNCTTLAAVRGFVDHAELFSHCCAVVHHGGAGTVASALRAGLPSIICPLHFDQFMWADKLEYMGLGKMLPGTIFKESTVGAAAAVLSSALSELMGSHAFQSDCQRMQREMAAEDGTAVAAAHIRQLLRADFEVRPVYKKYGLLELPNGWEVDASSRSEVKFLYREIFEKQTYLQHGITVQDGDVVVDVGANIGLFALHLLVELGKQLSHIWLIEPLKPTVRQLRSNIAAFMAEEQVTVVPMALGRTAATKVFTYYPNMPGNATSKPVEKAALQEGCMHAYYFQDYSTHDCQVTTLDHLMSQHAITKIDLLKVDVEGDEEEVLLGMTQWEAVAQVVAEVHEVDGRAERIKELLQSHGFLVVVDRGSAPSAVMLYAAKEGRLFGEYAPRSSRTPVPGSLSPAVANEATEPCTGVCGNTSHARMHGCPRLMRWREVRLLLLGVLVGSLAYNSWKSHSLVHVIWAPLSVRLSPMLLGVSRAQTAPSQAVGLPEQPTAGGNTHVKAVKIKVRKGPASEGEQKVRLAIRRHQVTPNNSTLRTADAESSFAAEASKVDSLQAATQLEALDSRTADGSGYDTVKQGPSVGEALDGTASQVSINTEEVAGFWEHGSDSVEGIIRKGRGGAKLPVQGAIRKAADVPVAPAGQSCESWLSQADAHTYERDFQRQPITVLEPSGLGADLPDCTVPCKIVGNSFGQNNEGMAAYDAHFGDSSKGQGLSVLRNMESMTNYPNLAVESAHADGYDIVMTTRLDSDVPASYLSWAEYMVMKPLAPKQEDVAAFISNCGAKSFRLQALEALSANFTVHSYGRCMHNKDTIEPKPDVLQRYRFTLAFENSQELDYVTEKYIQALEAGSVPIVIGATNIADYEVAPNSMLVLESMNDMAQVAARMLYLIKNATAYNEMLAWKARGPQDKFLALLDLSVVHSSCSLCIHLATRIRAGEEAAQPRQPPCSCRHGPGGPVVHHVLVRERGRFDTRDVFLKGNNMTVAGLHAAIQQAFNNAKHVPIWRSHRPDFKSGNWQTGSDAPVELRIYRVYQVGRTQRAALYGEASLDTDAKVAEVLETNPCAKLEVVFI